MNRYDKVIKDDDLVIRYRGEYGDFVERMSNAYDYLAFMPNRSEHEEQLFRRLSLFLLDIGRHDHA